MLQLTRELKDEPPVMKVYTQRILTAADRLETNSYKMPFPDLPFPKGSKLI